MTYQGTGGHCLLEGNTTPGDLSGMRIHFKHLYVPQLSSARARCAICSLSLFNQEIKINVSVFFTSIFKLCAASLYRTTSILNCLTGRC